MNSNDEATTAPPGTAGFNVREFARTAHGSHRGRLDLASLAEEPLDTESVRLVRALRDMERTTLHRVRDLLVTATHKDARVTAFLTTWMFERFWIADALDAVLDASPAAHGLPSSAGPARRVLAERRERRGPIRRSLIANITGTQIVAEHVTTSLVDEWITQAAYRRLAGVSPVMASIIEPVVEIKQRHIHFLAEEAELRLGRSVRARRITRRALRHTAWPLGSVDRSRHERTFFERHVFGDQSGRAEAGRIRAMVAALPGIGPGVASTVESRLVP
ncbi:hypothetical protein OG539_40735 [Actinacidiphila glaucinigra]|uniref:hypothetical protein n=1 Tax=Actinacidiphila glaucinigra TaxID=235986 RepID=UPI002DDB5EC2|nr:hypothetical protein [Actinacidiphila glaucinigra]WSD57898.1 hypothetical protein OIE69_02755 [Actinacidiphila glaucinigra]